MLPSVQTSYKLAKPVIIWVRWCKNIKLKRKRAAALWAFKQHFPALLLSSVLLLNYTIVALLTHLLDSAH